MELMATKEIDADTSFADFFESNEADDDLDDSREDI